MRSSKCFISTCILAPFMAISTMSWAAEVSTYAVLPAGNNDSVTLDTSGNVYVSHTGSYVSEYNGTLVYQVASDGTITEKAENLSGPLGNDFDSLGNLYISNFNSGDITKVTPEGESSLLATLDSGGGIVINSNDEIFVASYYGNAIYQLNSQGDVHTLLQGNGLDGPVGLALDEDENLYIGNYNNGKVFQIDSDLNINQIGQIPTVTGYITYASGDIYATGLNVDKIYKMSMGGDVEELVGTENTQFSGPNGITASTDGTLLYVSEYGGNVLHLIDLTKTNDNDDDSSDNSALPPTSAPSSSGGGSMLFALAGLLLMNFAGKRKLTK